NGQRIGRRKPEKKQCSRGSKQEQGQHQPVEQRQGQKVKKEQRHDPVGNSCCTGYQHRCKQSAVQACKNKQVAGCCKLVLSAYDGINQPRGGQSSQAGRQVKKRVKTIAQILQGQGKDKHCRQAITHAVSPGSEPGFCH